MLISLFEHSYFSQFGKQKYITRSTSCVTIIILGTFLGNNEADRESMKLSKKTTSLWSYLNRPDVLTALLNPMYEPNKAVIWPSVAPVSLVLWSGLYLRWICSQTDSKKALQKVQTIIDYDKNLKSKVIKMRKELLDLRRDYERLMKVDGDDDDDLDAVV